MLVNVLKEKVKLARNIRLQLQLLTLAPYSWNNKKIIDMFKVIDYAAKQL